MQVGPGQRHDLRLVLAHLVQASLQQLALSGVQARHQFGAGFQHPVQAAVGLALQDLVTGGQVQVPEQLAHLHAVLIVGGLDVFARQPWLQQRRLAGQLSQGHAVVATQGVRYRQVGLMQHIEQFDEERQVLDRPAFDQRQHVLSLFQTDKEVAVLGAGGNALEVPQAAQAVRRQKGFQLRPGQGGED
ncbi:hypothetical protein D9M71_649020 [compost metagenome]